MVGLAKKAFLQIVGDTSKFFGKAKAHRWPLLEKAFYEGCLSYADLELAKRLSRDVPQIEECVAALLCHLSAASRQGHLCISIDENVVFPPVEEVWEVEDQAVEIMDERILLWDEITKKVLLGREAIIPLLDSGRVSAVCRSDHLFYLQRYWKLESVFIKHMISLLEEDVLFDIQLSQEKVCLKVEELLSSNVLLEEQAQAILRGCLHPFTVIVGGPGTGKTYTAGLLIRVLWENLPEDQKKRFKIALAAPTGKAASNLEGSIQKALRGVEGFPEVSAQTLHTLLKANSRGSNRHTISADVLLIDECSMIDAHMMALLMQSLKPGARLIMLGDKHQLPPVEAGALFTELVEGLQASKKYEKNVVELKTCLRAELQSIISLATSINQGSFQQVVNALKMAHGESGLSFTPLQSGLNVKKLQRQLLSYGLSKFPLQEDLQNDSLKVLEQFTRFRMLVPLKKGPLGTEVLNQLFFEKAMEQACHLECFFAPIMIQSNDYRTGLFNGEVGLLVKKRSAKGIFLNKLQEHDYAIFASKSDHSESMGVRRISALLLPKFEYAYCLSIHKSQGSEFEHVLLLFSEGCERFGREALYTGATRARRQLEIWSSEEILCQMIGCRSQRYSGVKTRFFDK